MNTITSSTTVTPQRVRTRKRWVTWVRRALLLPVVLIGIFALVGIAWQAVMERVDARRYPAPGQLVDVGGYKLHLYSLGEQTAAPTVILIGCGACPTASWGWVQPEVARFTRVVAFDRAGFGWSEHSPAPQDAGQSAKELHTALRQAGIPGPYVLAGHSYGGLLARVFAAAYPDEVAGLVLVDPRHGDQANRYPPEGLAADRAAEQFMRYAPVLARLGILRLGTYFRDVASDLPARQAAEVTAFEASAKLFDALRVQGRSLNVTDAQALAAGPLGDRPLVVLSAGTAWLSVGAPADATRRAYTAMNIEQAGLSSNSVHRVVEGASHMSLVHRRDDAQATVTAIREVVEAAQSGQPLAR